MTDNQDLILTIARQYAELGWCVLPVPHRQKFPDFAWAEFQTRQPSADELNNWFRNKNVGMCVICGAVSSNLAVLDFDASGSYQAWAADHAEIAEQLPTDRRGDRYHVFIRTREPLKSQNLSIPGFDKAGEILAEGKLCVLPPTIHASGEARKWLIEPIRHVPLVTMEELGLAQPTQAEQQNLANEDIGQGERHSKLMSLAAKLRAQGHGVGFIFDMLLSVNGHRCKPPLPESEVKSIADWAGKLPAIDNHIDLEKNDDARKRDPTIIISSASLVEDDDHPPVLKMFQGCVPYMEALGKCELSFIVQDFLPETYLVVLGGNSKAGKSCFMTALVHAVCEGLPFLGMETTKSPVLWCAYEESEIERGMIIKLLPNLPADLYISHEQIMIDKPEGLATLRFWIRHTGAKLLVLDPLHAAHGAESLSDGKKARQTLMGLKNLCREEKVCAVVIHHFNKQVKAGMTRERMADSNQILATASMDLLMDATDPVNDEREIEIKGRGRGAFANQTWVIKAKGMTSFELVKKGSGRHIKAESKADRILNYLDTVDEPVSANEIALAVNQRVELVRNRLTNLKIEGKVEIAGKFGRGDLYRIAPTQGELEVVA